MRKKIFTIGHSTHAAEKLVAMLQHHHITAVADVRSSPYSRVNPQFNRESFRATLKRAHIAYVFLGEQLGARTTDPTCYVDGKVQYERLGQTLPFREGLSRLISGIESHRIVILCAEKDPLTCHRGILVSRHLETLGICVQHILHDGSLERHDEALSRLLNEVGLGSDELFRQREELILLSYAKRGEQIAYALRPETPAEARLVTNE